MAAFLVGLVQLLHHVRGHDLGRPKRSCAATDTARTPQWLRSRATSLVDSPEHLVSGHRVFGSGRLLRRRRDRRACGGGGQIATGLHRRHFQVVDVAAAPHPRGRGGRDRERDTDAEYHAEPIEEG